ncbi:MAG: regulatory iron-sulfur-containing complex subunit RicT, partial [Blastopirellula sp. JB062]
MADYVVRYGAMRLLGVFSSRAKDEFQRDESVIVRTKRGLEHGIVLCVATDQAVEMLPDPTRGHILRGMTAEDESEIAHLQTNSSQEFDLCRQFVEKLKLEMQLVDIEHLFGGERIVIYYLAENRVDFRELVKLLAAEFHTRIEMRQIGVRDEAKLLAYLYKHTSMQVNFAVNPTCLVPTDNPEVGSPDKLGLLEILRFFLIFRHGVITRRLEHEQAQLDRRIHILQGFALI